MSRGSFAKLLSDGSVETWGGPAGFEKGAANKRQTTRVGRFRHMQQRRSIFLSVHSSIRILPSATYLFLHLSIYPSIIYLSVYLSYICLHICAYTYVYIDTLVCACTYCASPGIVHTYTCISLCTFLYMCIYVYVCS